MELRALVEHTTRKRERAYTKKKDIMGTAKRRYQLLRQAVNISLLPISGVKTRDKENLRRPESGQDQN